MKSPSCEFPRSVGDEFFFEESESKSNEIDNKKSVDSTKVWSWLRVTQTWGQRGKAQTHLDDPSPPPNSHL